MSEGARTSFRVGEPGKIQVGWIGTGVMGASMCGHLLSAGYPVTVNSRTRAKAESLVERGARWCDSPVGVAAASDVVFTMLGYPADLRSVVLGERGVMGAVRAGTILVDCTTSEPGLARQIEDEARGRGAASLDAPVSGGDVGAREARLAIMVGGDTTALEAVRPLLLRMGKTVVHQGPAGAGQHTKMVNQILIASGMVGVCEALLYGFKAGLDLTRTLEAVGGGAAGSWSLANYGPRMLKGNFDPGFFVDHFIKDMEIALAEASRMRLAVPGLALAHQLYQALRAQGHGRKGTHALMLALAELSGVEWRPVATA